MSDRATEIEKTLGLGRHKRRISRPVTLAAVGLVIAGAAWWAVSADMGAKVTYVTDPATLADLSVTVSATGTVEPTNQVDISSELSGTIAAVAVDFNDMVEVGQVLARLDTTKLEAQLAVQNASLMAAEARVEQAQTTLTEAFDDYETARELDERGVASHQAFRAAEAVLKRAEAALQIADADRELADATLEIYRADLEKAVIRAPIKGVVLDRAVDTGQIVAAALSAPVLFTIAEDLASMELQVAIDEADIGRIAVGNPATFGVDAYDDVTFPAEISEIRYAPETVDGVVSYMAVLMIDNSDLRLRPGMTATADIVVAQVNGVLTVPNAALRYEPPQSVVAEGGESGAGLLGLIMPDHSGPDAATAQTGRNRTVWRLTGDGGIEQVAVVIGQSDGKRTEVLSGDITAGDALVVDQAGE